MSRWAFLVVACSLAGRAAVAGPKISTSDVRSASELRAGTTEVIAHDLATALASTRCESCHVDAAVTKLVTEPSSEGTAVAADLSFTVTDERGEVITIVATCARAVARKTRLAALRDEALHGAVASAAAKVARALAPQVARR